jgi:DNA-binding transcriptional MerR regulator
MFYTLGQAAKATGISKPTLSRAIKGGRLSGQKQPDGSFLIDPAELHRVFPLVSTTGNDNGNVKQYETPSNPSALQAQLETLREERERERQQLQATIDDLRDERGRLLRVLEEQAGTVKQLTYQPRAALPTEEPTSEPAQAPAAFLGASARFWVALALISSCATAWFWWNWQH